MATRLLKFLALLGFTCSSYCVYGREVVQYTCEPSTLCHEIFFNNIMLSLQDMENKIRQTLNEIYFGKTKDIVNDLR